MKKLNFFFPWRNSP